MHWDETTSWLELWPLIALCCLSFSYLRVISLINLFISASCWFYSSLRLSGCSGIWGHVLRWTSRSDRGSGLRGGPPGDARRWRAGSRGGSFRRRQWQFQPSWYGKKTFFFALFFLNLKSVIGKSIFCLLNATEKWMNRNWLMTFCISYSLKSVGQKVGKTFEKCKIKVVLV